jgi:hypothetical protein
MCSQGGPVLHTMNRTAIVFASRYLSTCKAVRLEHLLQTAPPNMDVWFLHNHQSMTETENIRQSKHNLEYFQKKYGLQHVNQLPTPMRGNFDDNRSVVSKSSFLQFSRSHPEYEYAWLLEDDVIMAGDWTGFFERYDDNDSDFISHRKQQPRNWDWYHINCNIDTNYLPPEISSRNVNKIKTIDTKYSNSTRINCDQFLDWSALWPLIRVSRRGATHLYEDLMSGVIQGHHEAIVQAMMLKHTELKFTAIPNEIANITAGGWGPWEDSRKLKLDVFQPITVGKVYHPVKCDAYPGKRGEKQFERLMMAYGWEKNEGAIVR